MSDLLQRLDDAGRTGLDMSPGDPDCRDAASTIRRLSARVKMLEEALGPFTQLLAFIEAASELDEEVLTDTQVVVQFMGNGASTAIYVSDLRRARAALNNNSKENGDG